jgi:hypothetical protein
VDYVVLDELANNVDGFAFSWYLQKEPDAAGGKWVLWPPWDADIGFGNVNYHGRYCSNTSKQPGGVPPFKQLFQSVEFKNEARCRYQQLRAAAGPLDAAHLDATLDAFVAHIKIAKARDLATWGHIGRQVWPNNFVGKSWADEVTYLRYWLRRRLAFMDGAFPGTCTTVSRPPSVAQIGAPTPAVETVPRPAPTSGGAPAYVPISGPVPAALAAFACPP